LIREFFDANSLIFKEKLEYQRIFFNAKNKLGNQMNQNSLIIKENHEKIFYRVYNQQIWEH
jgi:hypothetical protein